MGKIFVYAILFGSGTISIVRPWVGIVLAYLIIMLKPGNIWWWWFEGIPRHFYWVALPTIIGFILATVRGKLSYDILKNKFIFYFIILWLFFTISYLLGPYVDVHGRYRWHDAASIFTLVNKIFVIFFIACACINSDKKLKYMALAMIISCSYLIYWANAQYVFGHQYGRIHGPGGLYTDENVFGMFFVCGLPFLYYFGFYFKKKVIRYGIWLIIPFGWHAIFLAGSRGALIGLVTTLIMVSLRSPKKIIGILLIPAFLGAYMWQAGSVMKSRTETISEVQETSSAQTRFEAWDAAIEMIKNHPLTGVGLASFGPAFLDHSDKDPREAHNTFFQITAESGVIAGAMYLLIIFSSIFSLWRKGNELKSGKMKPKENALFLLNEAVLVSFTGLVVCSLFLSLQLYEIFFFLCVMVNSLTNLSASPVEVQEN